MNLFYTTDIQNKLAVFHDEEARHCTHVLRHKPGDTVHFVDGQGSFYEGVILDFTKKECSVQIRQQQEERDKTFRTHIAIAPTKNIDRFEWFLEKTTEIGIDEVTPLLCEHSERKQIRLDRLEKILVAAMKQSLKATLPQLNNLMRFEEFITKNADPQRFIAYLGEDSNLHLKDICQPNQNTMVLIGPEGDFSQEEIQTALAAGFKGVSLGSSRLRTETAGIAACHIVNLINT